MLENTEPSSRKVQTIMYRNHPHQDLSRCGGTRTTMLELSLHTTNHWPSQPTIRQNASEHMCRRSLGCIPPGVSTQPDLGRSDFAIPQPSLRQGGAVGTRSHGSPTNGAPRDAPEPDSQFERTDASTASHPGRRRHHQPAPKPLQSEVIKMLAEYQSSLRRAQTTNPKGRRNAGKGRRWYGGERVRTDDPLLAKQVLSQLSYTPTIVWWAREDLNLRPHAYQACALTS